MHWLRIENEQSNPLELFNTPGRANLRQGQCWDRRTGHISHFLCFIKISSGPWPKKEDWLKKKDRNQRRPGCRRKKTWLEDRVSSCLGPCLSLSLSQLFSTTSFLFICNLTEVEERGLVQAAGQQTNKQTNKQTDKDKEFVRASSSLAFSLFSNVSRHLEGGPF